MARKKALRWRVQSNNDGGFDELVVTSDKKHGCLIHAEMMDDRSIFVSVGPLSIWAHVDKHGRAIVTGTENGERATATQNEGTDDGT